MNFVDLHDRICDLVDMLGSSSSICNFESVKEVSMMDAFMFTLYELGLLEIED